MDCRSKKITIRIIRPIPFPIGISACLLGMHVKYSGGANTHILLNELVRQKYFTPLPVCPELFGGLSVPREPAEITGSESGVFRVTNRIGGDVSEAFHKGADETLQLLQLTGVNTVILKSFSPSCGEGQIYDGSFTGTRIAGDGVTVALLKKYGITCLSSDMFTGLVPGIYTGVNPLRYQGKSEDLAEISSKTGSFELISL